MAEPSKFLQYIIAGRDARVSSMTGKCLLLYYCSNVSNKGTFFKSFLDICTDTKISESTVRRFNNRMRDMGVLSWVEGNSLTHKANEYTMHLPKMQEYVVNSRAAHDADKVKAREKSAERSRLYRERQKKQA